MHAKLNGWQRLWVLLAVLHFIAVATIGVINFPDGTKLEAERANLALKLMVEQIVSFPDATPKIRDELLAVLKEKNGVERLRRETYGEMQDKALIASIRAKSSGKLDLTALEKQEKLDAEQLRDDRAMHALQCLGWWLIPLIAIYLFGYGIGWVIKGFRGQPKS